MRASADGPRGVEDEEQSLLDLTAGPGVCSGFADWEVALWIGGLETERGTIYCAEPV